MAASRHGSTQAVSSAAPPTAMILSHFRRYGPQNAMTNPSVSASYAFCVNSDLSSGREAPIG